MPEFLLLLPAKYLKTCPLLSSSHYKQSFNLPSSTFSWPVIQAHMQICQHCSLVLRVLSSQIWAQGGVNPREVRQCRFSEEENTDSSPQERTGEVRFRDRYVDRSDRVLQAPH
jgi:hypothetical protein